MNIEGKEIQTMNIGDYKLTTRSTKKSAEIDVDKLLEILPKLIRENDTVKGAIITALSSVVATKEDIKDLIKEMDKRFEAVDKRFEAMQNEMHTQHREVMSTLDNIKQAIGAPFEQFARNVISRILEGEGVGGVELKKVHIDDPEGEVFPETMEVEIDGISDDPPIIAEITTVLRERSKVEKFIQKKAFVEKLKGIEYRGFFVASGSILLQKERGDIEKLLRENGCEFLNL